MTSRDAPTVARIVSPGVEPRPVEQQEVIGGRAAEWALPDGGPTDDEGFEPVIIRGRE